MGHILGDKTNFNKYKKIKNIEGMFSDDSRIQLNTISLITSDVEHSIYTFKF